jgi:hypothetical protein
MSKSPATNRASECALPQSQSEQFETLEAAGGNAALEIVRRSPERVDLLIPT